MLIQTIKMAWSSITSGKLRSFLTMLGIIIGVIALVVLVSLVNGATGAVMDEITTLGNDMLTVTVLDDKGNPLQLENVSELTAFEEIAAVAPYATAQAMANRVYTESRVTLCGTSAAYIDIQGLKLENGRFLKTADMNNSSYVAVLTHDAREKFFGDANAVGQQITIAGRSFTVVGVLAESGSMMEKMFSQLTIYVPFTVEARMAGRLSVSTIYASASESTDDAEAVLDKYFMKRLNQDDDAYSIINMSAISNAMDRVTGTLSLLLAGIAAISLLVGGIGIMNIMLVSVTERTREIGIRKAIGAGRGSIMLQFLLEALIISILGCIIGLLCSWGLLEIVNAVAGDQLHFTIELPVAVFAILFSSAIGLMFGLYPANKAAKKNPIEALRYEG